MLPERQTDMGIVLDNIVAFGHLPERDLRLVLLSHGPLLPCGGRREQRKRLVPEGLDRP
ncbi:hypothetical protein D3C80_1727130 [compost metagenome]